MKYTVVVGLMCLIIEAMLVAGCGLVSDSEDTNAKGDSLSEENINLQEELDSLRSDYESLSSDHQIAAQTLEELKKEYQSLLHNENGASLRNPTWQELKSFIELDDTDFSEYVADVFDCEGFTLCLRDNAWRRGFRSAFVAVGFGEGNAGHALNAFDTVDMGTVYIDNTDHDAIAYVQVGKRYGSIAIDGVKEKFIATNMKPEEFWGPLDYAEYTGSLFGYAYYENFTQRRVFHQSSIDAFNAEIQEFNRAVDAYNNDEGNYTFDELDSWENKITSWSENLEKLGDDLGSSKLEPLDIVTSVEMYWN